MILTKQFNYAGSFSDWHEAAVRYVSGEIDDKLQQKHGPFERAFYRKAVSPFVLKEDDLE